MMPGASDDVQRYNGMVSGSVTAIAYPTIELVAADPTVVWCVKDLVLQAFGLQSASGVVIVRFGVWFEHQDGSQHPIHSVGAHALSTVGPWASPSSFPTDWFNPVDTNGDPLTGCSIKAGFTAQGGQPNSNTKLVNGFGRFRLLYKAL